MRCVVIITLSLSLSFAVLMCPGQIDTGNVAILDRVHLTVVRTTILSAVLRDPSPAFSSVLRAESDEEMWRRAQFNPISQQFA